MSQEDFAQTIELSEWERNNAPRPHPVKYRPGDEGYGPELCDECDADMPPQRREHGFTLCVACKTEEERAARQYAR